jgi:hypothetical protein
MSVPREVVVDAPAVWNAQADEFNQWDDLGEDEKLEWTANRAAEWALEPMYAELHDATKGAQGYEVVLTYSSTEAATKALDAIRAMISPEGKLKGGESDRQGNGRG